MPTQNLQPPDSDETDRDLSVEVVGLRRHLLDLAKEADRQGNDANARALSEARFLLADYERAGAPPYEVQHEQRMDRYRTFLALALLCVLFAVIVIGVISEGDLQGVAELATPVSGLAGIAIGWLFSGGRQA